MTFFEFVAVMVAVILVVEVISFSIVVVLIRKAPLIEDEDDTKGN